MTYCLTSDIICHLQIISARCTQDTQGLVNVPFWWFWTSPSISVGDYIPNSWVMFKWDIYQPLLMDSLWTSTISGVWPGKTPWTVSTRHANRRRERKTTTSQEKASLIRLQLHATAKLSCNSRNVEDEGLAMISRLAAPPWILYMIISHGELDPGEFYDQKKWILQWCGSSQFEASSLS